MPIKADIRNKLLELYRKFTPIKVRLLSTSEGRIFALGMTLSVIYVVTLAIIWLVSPKVFQILVGMSATHVLFGRAAALSFGYTMGLEHAVIIPVSFLIETIIVMVFFPLFVFTIQRLIFIERLNNFMERIKSRAEEKREFIRKYGIIGLFCFVWFPFWMTGPIVGSVIGFFIGLSPWLNLSIVLGGTYLAITCWAVFLRELHERVAAFNPFVPVIMLICIILIVVTGNFLHDMNIKSKKRQREKNKQS